MLIRKVWKEDGKVTEFEYVHSSRNYKEQNGIRSGKITITKPGAPLQDQLWQEVYDDKNYSWEDYMTEVEDNGVRRLKRVKLNFERVESES